MNFLFTCGGTAGRCFARRDKCRTAPAFGRTAEHDMCPPERERVICEQEDMK
jgi:hypothetical protein